MNCSISLADEKQSRKNFIILNLFTKHLGTKSDNKIIYASC